jgi:hypothetical protein
MSPGQEGELAPALNKRRAQRILKWWIQLGSATGNIVVGRQKQNGERSDRVV